MSEELKPCECGDSDVVVDDLCFDSGAVQVLCCNCQKATDWYYGYTPEEAVEARQEAIAAWNAGERDG